jgi:hypothetical protein
MQYHRPAWSPPILESRCLPNVRLLNCDGCTWQGACRLPKQRGIHRTLSRPIYNTHANTNAENKGNTSKCYVLRKALLYYTIIYIYIYTYTRYSSSSVIDLLFITQISQSINRLSQGRARPTDRSNPHVGWTPRVRPNEPCTPVWAEKTPHELTEPVCPDPVAQPFGASVSHFLNSLSYLVIVNSTIFL